MLYKSSTSNVEKTAQKSPRAVKRGSRPSQTPPKWSPRTSRIHFFCDFWAFLTPFQICFVFLTLFLRFFVKQISADILKLVVFPRENAHFYKIAIFDDKTKNREKIIQKCFQNRPQIYKNRCKIEKNREKNARWRKMR